MSATPTSCERSALNFAGFIAADSSAAEIGLYALSFDGQYDQTSVELNR